jgi:transposase
VSQAEALLSGQPSEYVIGDKGYASAAVLEFIERQGAIPVIPPHPRSLGLHYWFDRHLYKERHAVECFFNKLKHYRRIFSRFDKLATRFLSFVCFASALICLR